MSKSGPLQALDILIVDDEADIRELVAGILSDEGYNTRTAGDSDSALREIRARRPALVILDIWLQGSRLDGLQVLDEIKKDHAELPVLVISGHGNIETAVTAIKKGAYDFVEKPFKADRILLTVERALEAQRLRKENESLKERLWDDFELVGQSHAISQLRQMIDKIAPTNSRILISGPPGSGKEIVARLVHAKSRRQRNPFIAINCATIAPERMEIELFGVEGASDGGRKVGLFEQSHGGTLFLDEIADMPLETQGKILRVLVEQNFQRVGGGPKVQVDVRVVSSCSADPRTEISDGRLREDLYHRLNVVGDPRAAADRAARRHSAAGRALHEAHLARRPGLQPRKIGDDAMAALQAHNWPGNVRQLRNNVERLMILAADDPEGVITADLLPTDVGNSTPAVSQGAGSERIIALPLRDAREMFEKEYLLAQINRFGGNISRTAAFIGMERSALHRKLKSLGINTGGRGDDMIG